MAAPPETVFAYFTDPVRMVRWMGVEATLDPRPGGACRIRLSDFSVVLGEYLEVEPYHRLVFTWGYEQVWFEMPPQSTTIEVSLMPEGDETVVVLRHGRLPGALAAAATVAGWAHYLPRLVTAAGGADPGPDPWLDIAVVAQDLSDRFAHERLQ